MYARRLLLTLVATFLISSPIYADRPLSSAGTRFAVGYRPDLHDDNDPGDKQIILVGTRENHNVNFTVSDGDTTVSYAVNSTFEQKIDLHSLFAGQNQKGIMILSSDGISELIVMGFIAYMDGLVSDTYTVFPLHNHSSYVYFAVSLPHHTFSGFVQIVGTEADTTVSFTPVEDIEAEDCPGSPACPAGETCTVTLQSLDVLLLCSFLNLTGTKIVSDKPVSVFSGHNCAPINDGNCEFLMEQLLPLVTWGQSFLVGPLQGRSTGEVYRVVSGEADTQVSVYCTGTDNNVLNFNFEFQEEGSSHTFSVGDTRRCSIRANKPVTVVLLAPNEGPSMRMDGAFMSLIPPEKQLIDTVTILGFDSDTDVTITIPTLSCPNAQCSIRVDNGDGDSSIDVGTSSDPIYCSMSDVCGYSVVTSLRGGVHSLRLSEPAGMAVIAYTITAGSGYGTVAGLALNHIAVSSPKLSITSDGNFPLMTGERLVLTCSVIITDHVDDCINVSARWLRGERGEEIKSLSPSEIHLGTPFKIEYTVYPLSKEDTDVYRCEADLSSRHTGLLATASESVHINVTDPVTYGYIQLLIVGVTKCSEWVLIDTVEKATKITEMVVEIIRERCSCNFSSQYISRASLKCPSVDPDSSNEVLFRARVQEGGNSPVSYSNVVAHLEADKSNAFSLKGIRLTIMSADEDCSVMINSLDDPTTCFTTDPPTVGGTGGLDTSNDDGDKTVIIVAVVASCAVVFLLGLASLIVGAVVITRRHANISNQRPKSIHLHARMVHAGNSTSRLMPSGDSVTSFSPQSGSPNHSNIYVMKDSIPSSPTTVTSFPLPQNGVTTSPFSITHDHLTEKTSFPLPQNGVGHVGEEEENYKTMKTDLSQLQLPISHV